MTDQLQPRFDLLQHTRDGDWADVLQRAGKRRSRSRLLLAVALATLVALAAPTALALRGSIVDFFESEQAPRSMVVDFERMDVGAPPGLENRIVYGQTRKVLERRIDDGQVLTLWVAPNRRGGYCTALVGPRHPGGFGCVWADRPRLSPSIEVRGPIKPEGVQGGPFLISGSVGIDDAETIELHYEDGAVVSQELAWVSQPIDAAFFLFDVPRQHWAEGHQYDRLVVRDEDGDELLSERLTRLPRVPR